MNGINPTTGRAEKRLNPAIGNAIMVAVAGIVGYVLSPAVMTAGVLSPEFPFFLWQFILVIPVALLVSLMARRLNGSVVLSAACIELIVRIRLKLFGVTFMESLADVSVVKPIIGYAATVVVFFIVLSLERFLRKVSNRAIFLVPVSVVLVAAFDWLVQWALGWGFVF